MAIDYAEIRRLVQRGRRAEKTSKAVQGCITAALVTIATGLTDGWLLMLAIGILHHDWWPAIPPMGYWWAVWSVFLLRGVFSRRPPTTKAKD